jgi:hypothetical protein
VAVNQPGWGLLEYYRQMANGTGVGAPTAAVAPNVTLRAPAGISTTTLYTMTGRQVMVRADRTVELTEEEAKGFISNGWQRIERDEALEPGTT